MKVRALAVLICGLIVLVGCGGGSSTSDALSYVWGTNLDYYEVQLAGLSDSDFEIVDDGETVTGFDTVWSLVFGDNQIQVDAYTSDHLGEGSSDNLMMATTEYSLKDLDGNTKEITVDYVDYDLYEVYSLTPTSSTQGNYKYEGYRACELYNSKTGQYEITTDGKNTTPYQDKYNPPPTDGGTGGTDGGSGSGSACDVSNSEPWTGRYISWNNGGMSFDQQDIDEINGDCTNACIAVNNNDMSERERYCGYIHWLLDDKSEAYAEECDACNY
ncbi:MAG: hypothetical protein C0619_04945 [Desulfuromonas sp.]|nr:MAG: hypothetical protein C0619_04945 [Desulfuromonas sp.]